MKKQAFRLVMLFGLLVAAGLVAQAQTAQRRVVVSVPFEFVVGSKTLPAGDYVIRRIARESDKALLVERAAGGASELVITYAVEADKKRQQQAGQASVDFHRYGDRYFLFQVWAAGANTGRALPRSQQERELRREMQKKTNRLDIAHLVGEPQVVTIRAK